MAGIMGDVTNNLLGLQQLAQGRQELEQRNKSIENNRIASEKLRTFQQSQASGNPDYEAFNEAVLLSPELSKNVLAGIGVQEKRQGLDAADFAVKAASVIDNRPEFMNLVKQRIERIQARGGDPKDTIALAESYLQGDVEGARSSLKAVSAALANQGYLDKDLYAQAYGPTKSEGFSLSEGQTRFDAQGNKIASVGKTYNPNESGPDSSANIREIEYYNRMPEGPAKEAAGRKLGLLPGWGYDADNARSLAEAKARGKVVGADQAGAAVDLPKIESSSARVIGLVNELLKHKGKGAALGLTSYLPSVRGTERAGFENRLKQIQGDAFLKAFESLKGGGAITEIEGQKATQALNRMNETVDEAEFDAAAADFIAEINRFKDIATQRAKGGPQKQVSEEIIQEPTLDDLLGKY